MSIGGSSSDSKSTPVDMTPTAFLNLQQPFADQLATLLGIGTTGGTYPSAGSSSLGGFLFPSSTTGTTSTSGGGSIPGAPTDGIWDYANATYTSGKPITSWRHGWEVDQYGNIFNYNSREGNNILVGTVPKGTVSGSGSSVGGRGGYTTGGSAGGDLLSGIPEYPGSLTGTMGAEETALLKALTDKVLGAGWDGSTSTTQPLSTAETYLTNLLTKSLSDFATELAGASLTGAYGGVNPLMDQYITAAQRPTMEALAETLDRTLPSTFTSGGQFVQPQGSSAFDRAAAIATRGAANAASDIATEIAYNELEASQNREAQAFSDFLGQQVEAAQSLPQVTATEVQTLIDSLSAAALPRLVEEAGIDRGVEIFNNRLSALLQAFGVGAAVTSPTIATESATTSNSFNFGLPTK